MPRSSFSKKGKGGGTKKERKAAKLARAHAKAKGASNPAEPSACDDPSVSQEKPPKKSRTEAAVRPNATAPLFKDPNGAFALSVDLLVTLPPNIWWRILQDPEGELDVATATHQSWSLIYPLYLKANLFHPPSSKESSKLIINKKDGTN